MLYPRRDEIPGTIVFCFQPAEEGRGGATRMIEEGLLEDPRVDAAAIDAAAEQIGDLEYAGDHFASAEYRAHLTKVYVKRALKRAAGI
jgi:metal-dependent amidase/aminoacylase/carboxypeptidase family protein